MDNKLEEKSVLSEYAPYYNQIRHKEHIFIYAVAGRSSSTFVQRLLNSSGEVCIYGELHYLADKLLDTLHQMMQMNQGVRGEISEPWMTHTKKSHDNFVKAIQSGKHDTFYPNAIRDMDVSIALLKEAFANMLKPINHVDRFGYKEIRLQNITTLNLLRKLFPDSYFIFQFRNPLEQWISIKNFMGTFPYSKKCQDFIDEYCQLSELYIASSLENSNNCIFISENTFSDSDKINNFCQKININKIDESLLIKKVGSSENKKNITVEEKELITNSKAYSYYLHMCELETGCNHVNKNSTSLSLELHQATTNNTNKLSAENSNQFIEALQFNRYIKKILLKFKQQLYK